MQIRRRQDSMVGSDDSRAHPLRELAEKILPCGGKRDSYVSARSGRLFSDAEKGGRRMLWAAKGDADVGGAEIPSGNEDVQDGGETMPPNGGFVPDFAQPQAPVDDAIGGRRADFVRSLAELRDRGVKIGFIRGVFLTTSGLSGDDRDLVRVLEAIVIKKSRFRFVDEDGAHGNLNDISSSAGADIIDQSEINPQDVLESNFGNVLLADPDLLDERARGNRRTAVAPYVLDISKTGGVFRLTATNWVSGKTVLSLEIPEDELTVPTFVMTCLQMTKALNEDFSRRALADAVEAFPSAQESLRPEDSYLFNDADASAWSLEEENTSRSSWRGLLDRFDVKISGQPFGTNIDSVIRHVAFDPDQNGRAGSPLNVNGITEGIVISPKSKKLALAMGGDEKMTPYIDVESVHDKYGNLIIPVFSETGKKHKKMVFVGFQVIPPHALAHNGKDGYVPVGVDLSEFGLGDHPLLFKQRVEFPAATAEKTGTPYAKYSSVKDKDESAQQEVFAKAAAEIAKVEAFCGFAPNDVVGAVYLIPSHVANAHTIETNPDTVFIWDEIFPEILAEGGEFAVSHETFHLMDFKFGISEDESVKQAFQAMKGSYDRSLFPLIDESGYLPFNGGHSAENAAETVASLLNTVYTGEFDESYATMDEQVAGLYECTLSAVRNAMIKGGCSESAPMIAAIDAILACRPSDTETPIETFVVPHMEDLLMPNMEGFEAKAAAGTLELADMPIFVLDAFLFKKVVLKSSELSFIYVYHQNEQENVELVRLAALMSAMIGGATYAMPYEQALRYADRFGFNLEGGMIYAFDRGTLVPELTQPVAVFEELRGVFEAPPEDIPEEAGFLDEDDEFFEVLQDVEPDLLPEESKGNLNDILISPAP